MDAFDGNAYRKAVLKPLLAGAGAGLDPFTVLAIPPEEDDQAAIDQRVSDVIAFWRREQNSARYRSLVTRLLEDRRALVAAVADPERRAAARRAAQAGQAQAERERAEHLDRLVDRLVRSHPRGVPRSRVERLRVAAARRGIGDEAVTARLAAVTVVDDAAEPLPGRLRAHLRATLADYNRLTAPGRGEGDGPAGAERPARSLFDVLGVDPSAPDDVVRAHHAALAARNRQRRHDRLRTLTDELLTQADQHTHGAGRARYQATMVAEVRERLTPEVEVALIADDRVSAAEFEHLVRQAVALGLDPATARTAVIIAAADLGGAVETGPAHDYVLCPGCGAVEAAPPAGPARRVCRRCRTPLYRSCPSCGQEIEASAFVCAHCGADLRALAEADRERRERLRAAERLAGVDRERALVELLAEHPDFAPARHLLAATPPGPPTGLATSAGSDSIVVHWSPSASPGVTGYRVTRYQGGGRSRPVGLTQELSMEDAGVRPGETVRYAVVALRGGRESAEAEIEQFAAFDVTHLHAHTVEGAVELTWRSPRAGDLWLERSVEVDGGTAGALEPARRQRVTGTALTDADVEPGTTYRYRLFVEYPVEGRAPLRTPGDSVAVATPPGAGAVRLVMTADDRRIALEATAADGGELRILRTTGSPPPAGRRLGADALAAAGTALPAGAGAGRAVDLLPGGPRWYVPVLLGGGGGAVAGAAVGHPGLPPVEAVTVEDGPDHLLVRWAWPAGCTEAQISWRGPAGPGQAKVTNMKYQIQDGFRLPAPVAGPYEIAVVPGARLGRDLIWAPPTDTVHHVRM